MKVSSPQLPEDLSRRKCWILDLDGTLIDPSLALEEVWRKLIKNSPAFVADFDFKKYVGLPLQKVLEIHGLFGSRRDEFMLEFEYLMSSISAIPSWYPDAQLLLSNLNSGNRETIFFTAKSRARALSALGKELRPSNFLLANGDLPPNLSKPSGKGLSAFLSKINVPRQTCVYVGDAEYDLHAAQDAGVDFVHARWGFQPHLESKYFANSPKDLVDALDCK